MTLYWKTITGDTIKVKDTTDSHLKNEMKMIELNVEFYNGINGIGVMDWDGIDFFPSDDDNEYPPICLSMKRELSRRSTKYLPI